MGIELVFYVDAPEQIYFNFVLKCAISKVLSIHSLHLFIMKNFRC